MLEYRTRLRVGRGRSGRAFTLPELLVVVGIIALLMALLLPPLQAAQAQAMRARCSAQLQQLGIALTSANHDFNFYPFWDDGSPHVRYTWVDVLIQQGYFGNPKAAYCPEDLLPDPLNAAQGRARRLVYPRDRRNWGIDYSYGIGVPLAAGGWAWRPGTGDAKRRRFVGKDDDVSGRVLAGDANWSWIYNLDGEGWDSQIWNRPTWYGNTVAWRHGGAANFLKQDGHVERLRYERGTARPVDTVKHFVWRPDEPLNAGPDTQIAGNFYPNVPPPSFQSTPPGDVFPNEMLPRYYTARNLWTLILHK